MPIEDRALRVGGELDFCVLTDKDSCGVGVVGGGSGGVVGDGDIRGDEGASDVVEHVVGLVVLEVTR